MNTIDASTDDLRYNEMQATVIKKAISLLEEDLFDHVRSHESQEYFKTRITYLNQVASEDDSNLFTTQYLRSLHVLFNSYYQFYQSSSYGIGYINADTERHFLYREVNDQLEDFLRNFQ